MIFSKASVVGSPSRFGAWLRYLAAALAVVAFASGTASAQFQDYSFVNVTSNKTADVLVGNTQLNLRVSAVAGSPNQVDFTFTNTGPEASSITDVYFDDGTLLGIASITSSSGVSFSQGASPGDLPGGNTIGFETTVGFLADSDPPTQPNGVNPGQSLTIRFDLIGGQTYADTIAAIEGYFLDANATGTLRIGIHVQGFDGGGSESFVNNPPTVPEPASIAMLGFSSLVGLGYAWRRRGRVVA